MAQQPEFDLPVSPDGMIDLSNLDLNSEAVTFDLTALLSSLENTDPDSLIDTSKAQPIMRLGLFSMPNESKTRIEGLPLAASLSQPLSARSSSRRSQTENNLYDSGHKRHSSVRASSLSRLPRLHERKISSQSVVSSPVASPTARSPRDENISDNRKLPAALREKADRSLQSFQTACAILHNTRESWEKRSKAMHEINDLLRSGRMDIVEPRVLKRQLQLLAIYLEVQLEDKRSGIVKDACTLLTTFGQIMGRRNEFRDSVRKLLQALFKKLYVTVAVMRQDSYECVKSLLTVTDRRVLIDEMTRAAVSDTHPQVRAAVADYLLIIVNSFAEPTEHGDTPDSNTVDNLCKVIKANVQHGDVQVRTSTRKLFHACYDVFRTERHRFISVLPASSMKNIFL